MLVDSEGKVTEVADGQAKVAGVKIGWKVIKVGEEAFTKEVLEKRASEEGEYNITLKMRRSSESKKTATGGTEGAPRAKKSKESDQPPQGMKVRSNTGGGNCMPLALSHALQERTKEREGALTIRSGIASRMLSFRVTWEPRWDKKAPTRPIGNGEDNDFVWGLCYVLQGFDGAHSLDGKP